MEWIDDRTYVGSQGGAVRSETNAEVESLRAAVARVRTQAAEWVAEQATYPDTPEGRHAAAALRCCSREILRTLEA